MKFALLILSAQALQLKGDGISPASQAIIDGAVDDVLKITAAPSPWDYNVHHHHVNHHHHHHTTNHVHHHHNHAVPVPVPGPTRVITNERNTPVPYKVETPVPYPVQVPVEVLPPAPVPAKAPHSSVMRAIADANEASAAAKVKE